MRAEPSRQTAFVDPLSPDTPDHLLPPLMGANGIEDERRAEELRRREQEQAILRDVYEKNVELRQQLQADDGLDGHLA